MLLKLLLHVSLDNEDQGDEEKTMHSFFRSPESSESSRDERDVVQALVCDSVFFQRITLCRLRSDVFW